MEDQELEQEQNTQPEIPEHIKSEISSAWWRYGLIWFFCAIMLNQPSTLFDPKDPTQVGSNILLYLVTPLVVSFFLNIANVYFGITFNKREGEDARSNFGRLLGRVAWLIQSVVLLILVIARLRV